MYIIVGDWAQAGRVLSRLAAKYHFEKIGQGRLTNDALIAMSPVGWAFGSLRQMSETSAGWLNSVHFSGK
jgi:hypothetical protein